MTIPLKKRLESKLVLNSTNYPNCLEFIGARIPTGYGLIRVGKGMLRAHRVTWMLHHGSMPTLHVLHRCDNPSCCNIDHLFLGTHADNMADKKSKGRTRLGDRKMGTVMVLCAEKMRMQGLTYKSISKFLGVCESTVWKTYNEKQRFEDSQNYEEAYARGEI